MVTFTHCQMLSCANCLRRLWIITIFDSLANTPISCSLNPLFLKRPLNLRRTYWENLQCKHTVARDLSGKPGEGIWFSRRSYCYSITLTIHSSNLSVNVHFLETYLPYGPKTCCWCKSNFMFVCLLACFRVTCFQYFFTRYLEKYKLSLAANTIFLQPF